MQYAKLNYGETEMVLIKKPIADKFRDPTAVKILSTVDNEGNPNAAVIGSLFIIDDETIGFADMMVNKTKQNLNSNGKASVLIWVPPLASYQLKGSFEGWLKSGPIYDAFNSSPMMRLQNVGNAKAIGLIKVKEIYLSMMPKAGQRIA
jgi:predicted pyridoxine 5'-phosphate oxidase superfamily flavin-nucleotide-binding protein